MNILLISALPPCKEFSGALLTYHMSRFILEMHKLFCLAVIDPSLRYVKIPDDISTMPVEYVNKLRERPFMHLPNTIIPLSSFMIETYNSLFGIDAIINRAVQFGRQHKIDAVWCIMQGQTIFRVALPVTKKLGVPLLTQVWDSPKWWLKENHVNSYSSQSILETFDRTISSSISCATASWSMSVEYEKKYRVATVPITASLDRRLGCNPGRKDPNSNRLVIGMAGQIYANNEWESLMLALDKCNWIIKGRDVVIRYFGYSFNISGHKKARIEYMGYRSQEEVVKILSEVDILYCPYFFSKSLEEVARTSFPSKLITYFAAGRPVFYHGPSYGSPARFIEDHNAGVACYSLEAEDIISCLSRLVDDDNLYESTARNGVQSFNSYFTDDVVKQNTLRFIESAGS